MLGGVPTGNAGVASAVNNGVVRAAGLVAVAALPLMSGLPADASRDPVLLDRGFSVSMLICAAMFALGGLVVRFGIRQPATAAAEPACRTHCGIPVPALEPDLDPT